MSKEIAFLSKLLDYVRWKHSMIGLILEQNVKLRLVQKEEEKDNIGLEKYGVFLLYNRIQ